MASKIKDRREASAKQPRPTIVRNRRLAKLPNGIERRIDLVTTFVERMADGLGHVQDKQKLMDTFPIIQRLKPLHNAIGRLLDE